MPKPQIYKAPKLFTFQQDVCNLLLEPNSNKTVCVISRRQCGKSTMIAVLMLYFGISFSNTKSYCLSPTLNQARNIFQMIISMTASAKGLITKKNAQDLEITLCNGSLIGFKSAQQGDRLRGFTVTGIMVCDEAAFQSDEILPLVLPWRTFAKAPLLCVSTPFVRSGWFYKFYTDGLDGKNGISSVNWMDEKYKEEMDAILPPDQLDMYRKMMPANQFKAEFLGEWLDDDGLVFSGFKQLTENNTISPTDKLYWGIDWALGDEGDDTVITAINQAGKQVFIDVFNDLSPTQTIERIDNDIKPYQSQTVAIQPETNSIGTVYTDNLKKKLPNFMAAKVIGFNTSNESKNAIVTNLQEAFEKQSIRILPLEKQIRELAGYAAEFNPKTRKISYNGAAGTKDDICIGLMLAWDCYLSSAQRGIYSFSKIR